MNPAPSLGERLFARFLPGAAPRADAAPAPVAVRADATTPTLSGAGISNALSGLGGARDSGAQARPNTIREYLSDDELIALMRSTVYRRIVELKPRWATSRGWALTDSSDEERPLFAALKRVKLQQTVRQADVWGRALGESRVFLVTDDPAPLSEPLDPKRVTRLHRLEVLDRREFSPLAYNGDAKAGGLGEPTAYRLHPWRPGVTRAENVHASRLLRFYGDDIPPSQRGYNFASVSVWGADAVGQTLWDGLRHLAQTGAGGARLAQELSIAVFKINPATASGDQREALLSRLTALNMMKSIAQAVFLAPGEEFSRVAATPSGFADLSNHARLELALLTGYPLTLLFGIAPGGLNTDGDSWKEAWWAEVAAYQEERYREPIEQVVEVLYYSELGGVPEEWTVGFNPLGELTEKERAEIRLLHTQADGAAIMDGILTAAEARARYTQPGGFAFDLQPVSEVAAGTAPAKPVDPETEAALRAEIEQALQGGGTPAAGGSPSLDPAAVRAAIGTDHADATEGACWIGLPLPDSARPGWEAARSAVQLATGPLKDPDDAPHVTVLYMGQVAPEALPEVEAAVREVAGMFGPAQLEAETVTVFPTGKDGTPVVLHVRRGWTLDEIQRQLLARLAHLVTQRQHVPFRAHVTLGYGPTLTPEQQAAAMGAPIPELQWNAAHLEVRYGDALVAVVPLLGRADAGGARG